MKLLFICTHNRCRSVMAEAIANHVAGHIIQARSAGSQPAGAIHPLTLRFLQERGIPTDTLKSQSWNDFTIFEPDVVVTVCDSAARETCPTWFGDSVQVCWALPDPSKLHGSPDELRPHFFDLMDAIEQRIAKLAALVPANLNPPELTQALIDIHTQTAIARLYEPVQRVRL